MTNQPVNRSTSQLYFLLQAADNALILGHKLSEWCGHGPILEQDIAITNTALDHLGTARSLYQYAAELFNGMTKEEQKNIFSSPLLQQVEGPIDEDDLGYLRDSWDFRNVLLAEQPNGDWAQTIARSFFIDAFNRYFFEMLKSSPDATIAAVAEKALKEVEYHLRWSSEWIIRLGDGTEESHNRMQAAVNTMWMYTGELFNATEADKHEASLDLAALKVKWMQHVTSILEEATIAMPSSKWMQEGGKEGRHSEHLGFVLAEMQFMQRAYPNMEW